MTPPLTNFTAQADEGAAEDRRSSGTCWPLAKRWLIKGAILTAFTALLLNPNLKRAFMQVGHILHPEALIQTNFVGLDLINSKIDRALTLSHGSSPPPGKSKNFDSGAVPLKLTSPNRNIVRPGETRRSEARLVARFVLRKIKYVSDYENWGNLDYWPTAQETWDRGSEDCDGRAILTASILRARGFHSAELAVGLDHMWVTVDENEKDPSLPPHWIALLGPNPDFSMPLHHRSQFGDLIVLAKAFLHPKAFRETSTELLADIPALRRALLMLAFLLLCYHPAKASTRLLVVVVLSLGSAEVLNLWQPDTGSTVAGLVGAGLFLIAWAIALAAGRKHVLLGRGGNAAGRA